MFNNVITKKVDDDKIEIIITKTVNVTSDISVKYELLCSSFAENIFSIKLTESDSSENATYEKLIYDISRNNETAYSIFCLLIKNTVTVYGLYDCLDEIFNII